jgi:hypothetical protein
MNALFGCTNCVFTDEDLAGGLKNDLERSEMY